LLKIVVSLLLIKLRFLKNLLSMISSGGELGRLYSIEDYLGEDSLEFG
jgi:hypothetical protein